MMLESDVAFGCQLDGVEVVNLFEEVKVGRGALCCACC